MNWVENSLNELLSNSPADLSSRLESMCHEVSIQNTKSIGYCHCLKLDGNGNVRWKDLCEFVAHKIVDYSIPKKEIDAAKAHMTRTSSTAKILELTTKAKQLFTDLKNTGEGGEMLLYILAQEILNIPQLISKMSLKTSGQVHYHGVDGIHVKFDTAEQRLNLYWGESKMYQDLNKGLTACFDSIKGFMLDSIGYASRGERDLQLVTSHLAENINDEDLENLIVRYFDKDDDLSNKLVYKGVCFIGFDFDKYPQDPNQMDLADLKAEIHLRLNDWMNSISTKICAHDKLELYEIHVFIIPFPSVENFRDHFIQMVTN